MLGRLVTTLLAVAAGAPPLPTHSALLAPLEAQADLCNAAGLSRGTVELAQATYYHPSLASQPMANGRSYDARNPLLAASNRYRLGTLLRVRRPDGSAAVVVEVADRGGPRLDLDLSAAAFERLAPLSDGRVAVCVEPLN
jgi:rare lipoprotein A (peptidoglycan hydrolase)